MKRPTIKQAKRLCSEMGGSVRAVIVLALYEDNVAGASYGETKLECQQTGYTLDRIIEALEAGEIPVWATRESEAVRNARIVREAIAEGSYCPVCKVPWSDCDCDDDSDFERIESGALKIT